MAVTRYGLTGPMTAYGTFGAKATGAATRPLLTLTGAGSVLWWLLLWGGHGR